MKKGVDALLDENVRLRQELRRLRAELVRDELTGLYNARHLRETLDERIRACRREARSLSLVFLDLDRFKDINERYGHEAAGRILAQVGRVLTRAIRAEDSAFRYAGDEFVVLLEGSAERARVIGERMRRLVETHEFIVDGERRARVTASLGVRTLRDTDTAESLLVEADRAMFEAKRRSRNVLVAA